MKIQISQPTITEREECVTLFKRRAPSCKIKITIQEGRLQGYLKVKGEPYTPVVLQGLPLHWRQREVGRVRQFLEKGYVKVHKGCIEVIQRGLGGGKNNVSALVEDKNVTAKQVIDVNTLLDQISDQREREVVRGVVNQFFNDPEPKRLVLQEADIGSEGIQVLIAILKDNPSFQALDRLDLDWNRIGNEEVKALIEALEKNQNLQRLGFAANDIGAAGAKMLAEVLEKNSKLLELDLGWNKIGDSGAKALAEALKKNQNLQRLGFAANDIGAAGAKALAKALKKNQNLQQLNFSSNDIGDAEAKALAGALKKNQNLQQLLLRHNQIGDAGAKALAEALEKNQNLQQLDLSYNNLGDEGAQALAEALEKNQNLQQLDLSYNNFGDEGAQALAESLEKNQNLQQLNLGCNEIGESGAKALAEALEKNQTLQWLSLESNQIGEEGTKALAEALRKNQMLQQLDLRYNQIGDAGAQAQIKTLLQENQQMASIFYEQTENLQPFIRSYQDQIITEEQDFLSFQQQIKRQHEKLETLRASLEEIIQKSGRMSLSEKYKKRLKNMRENLYDLLLRAFEDKLALLSQGYFSEESSEERKITLGRSLSEIWTFFFGFQCPDWLKGKEKSFITFCLLLSIAEGKEKESLDPPEMIFQRIGSFNQPIFDSLINVFPENR